jgi:hypothetical protein
MRPLLEFVPADVSAVRLERGGDAREAERDAGTWKGTSAPGVIDDMLHSLSGFGLLMEIPAGPTELTDYGLQPPSRVLQLRLRGRATPLVLQIGDRNPATTGVYVRLGVDGPAALAGALVEWEFDKAFRVLAPDQTGG